MATDSTLKTVFVQTLMPKKCGSRTYCACMLFFVLCYIVIPLYETISDGMDQSPAGISDHTTTSLCTRAHHRCARAHQHSAPHTHLRTSAAGKNRRGNTAYLIWILFGVYICHANPIIFPLSLPFHITRMRLNKTSLLGVPVTSLSHGLSKSSFPCQSLRLKHTTDAP